MDQREQILSKFDITIEMLLEYYTSRLRKSIYKSLLIDEKTTRKDLSLYGTDYTEQTKNFDDYKNKDRHVQRTLVSFQNNMFPGVRVDPRGGHNSKDLQELPKTSSSSTSSSTSTSVICIQERIISNFINSRDYSRSCSY